MHDTMSPVNTIKGAAQLLKQGTLSQEDQTKMLDAIINKADQLNEVLDAYWTKTRNNVDQGQNKG